MISGKPGKLISKNFKYIITIVLLSCAVCISGCDGKSKKQLPLAANGVLDLRDWDFERDGNIRLNGEWEFYWLQLLAPDSFQLNDPGRKPIYINMPSYWNDEMIDGRKPPVNGYGTYRLKILLKDKDQKLAIRNTSLATNFNLYINGELISSAGKVGVNRGSSVPEYNPGVKSFEYDQPEIYVVLQVSNFHHSHGGAGESLIIGGEDNLITQWKIIVFFEIFLFGCIFIIGIYHIGLFILLKKDKSPLYFGLFCFCVAIFNQFSGELFFYKLFLNNTGWEFRFLLVNLCVYLLAFNIMMFLFTLFPVEVNKNIIKFNTIIVTIFSVISLSTPTYIYAYGFMIFQFYLLISLAYCLVCLIIATYRKKQGALILLTGFTIFFLTAIIDVLSFNNVINYYIMSSAIGLLIFIISQAYAISERFAFAFLANEKLADELSSKSEELLAKNVALDRDIGKRIEAEKELENTRNYLSSVFNSLSSLLISIDTEGAIIQWNSGAVNYTGISVENAVGKKVWDVLDFIMDFRANIEDVFSSGEPVELNKVEVDFNGKRYLNIFINPLIYSGMEGEVIRIDDVTELEKKEEQLLQAQKMETIGRLAGGLAHDFNNVLSGITGTVSLMKYVYEPDFTKNRDFWDCLDLIDRSGRRARDMVRQLLSLSRSHEIISVPVDLNTSLENVIQICLNTFDKEVELKPEYYSGKAMIKGDPAQIEQVILNICVNALHAMTIMRAESERRGGILNVVIKNINADKHFCDAHPSAVPGRYWMLSHHDTGIGMDSRTVEKIFDPFFTTKNNEQGTGLGLSMAYNIVVQHGGFIDVYSETGVGSIFNVFLPELSESDIFDEAVQVEKIISGKGVVLVIDDEDVVRYTARAILKECGYDVIEAGTGSEGIGIFRDRYKEISVILLDMSMPGLSGKETFKELKRIQPDVKVLLSSGFKLDPRVEDALKSGVNGFIQKPYSISELSTMIYKILNPD